MTGTTTLKLFFYSGSIGVVNGNGTNVDRPIGNSINFISPNTTNGGGANYWVYSLTAGSGATAVGWANQASLTTFNSNGGGAGGGVNGKNYYHLGTRYTVSEAGLELQACAVGSSATADHVDDTRCTQAAYNNYVALNNTNTVMIWLGENDGTLDATWYSNTIALIGRWRTAILANGGSPLIILITPYQTTSSTTAAKCQQFADYHKQISNQYADVCWLGLGLAAGSYSFLNASGYLVDGVHPTKAGAEYFGTLIQNMLAAGDQGGRATRASREMRVSRAG